MIKAIIFDAGGVVLLDRIETVDKKICEKTGIPYDSFIALKKPIYTDLLSGKYSVEEFCAKLQKEFGLDFDVLPVWKKAYLEVMAINTELLEIVKKLKKNCSVAIISNAPKLHAELNKTRGVYSLFNPCIISCEVGLVKPDRRIFELALQKIGLKAKECVFIDDREEHLQIPKELGFQVIHFKNNKEFIEALKKLGLQF
ncbi:MAG: HAD family phosphatase [Candidatus Diapherotrites archaeon]|uniref:HAD family phosphatase n=1 Tax=Candidatus Iainarchaeum sp. TaxID=3101447 RepID=A0A7J4KUZ0_9ARCH|nr:HAD family phosphatase [Candidatus Diapherotrites archaeon]HIH21852.1 HAD family phosphatase [Candidatus Diapherotrites archaeon]HIH33608.1 HAD family phosphatase [Candidatus Diapherotrites archaeon]